MKVRVFNQQKDVPLLKASVKPIVIDVLKHENISTDEICVYFVSSENICQLHHEFFKDPTPTDCITFPIDAIGDQASGYHLLGEIFICPKAAIELQAPLESEITLYLVHGLLHLLGYNDIEETETAEMREAEAGHVERLIAKKLLLKL